MTLRSMGKYAALDDFEHKKRHLIPYREEYGEFRKFGVMQYDDISLQYASQKSPPEKTMGDRTKELDRER